MNILVSPPNSNFNTSDMRQIFQAEPLFAADQVYYIDEDLTLSDLDKIDILVGDNTHISTKILERPHPQLKWIQALSAGIDYLPLTKIKDNNIILTTLKGLHAEPIAESIVGMILSQYRALNWSSRQSHWHQPTTMSQMIKDKNIVIFGTGHIGSRACQLLQAFGANVNGINHNGHPAANFNKITSSAQAFSFTKDADIIINTMPLTNATKNYFNADFFNQLCNQPLFVNVGRGPSTNTTDLITALQTHKLSAAALDVVDPEPLPADSILWNMENVLITPHISGLYGEYLNEIMTLFKINYKQFQQNGHVKINQVDLNQGY